MLRNRISNIRAHQDWGSPPGVLSTRYPRFVFAKLQMFLDHLLLSAPSLGSIKQRYRGAPCRQMIILLVAVQTLEAWDQWASHSCRPYRRCRPCAKSADLDTSETSYQYHECCCQMLTTMRAISATRKVTCVGSTPVDTNRGSRPRCPASASSPRTLLPHAGEQGLSQQCTKYKRHRQWLCLNSPVIQTEAPDRPKRDLDGCYLLRPQVHSYTDVITLILSSWYDSAQLAPVSGIRA